MMLRYSRSRILGASVAALSALAQAWAVEVPDKTVQNLNTAIRAEADAVNRYRLFAQRADEDGNPEVAKLFRAAARAEEVHRENLATSVLSAGGQPVKKVELQPVTVRSTRENLMSSVQGEGKEQAKIYPGYIQQAEKDHAGPAVRSFVHARDTEAEHQVLFKDALANLGREKNVEYYVSKLTGDTVAVPAGKTIPGVRKYEYERVG